MTKETEREIKMIVARAQLEKMLASPLLEQLVIPGSEQFLHLTNIYYDTADLALKNHGLAYRIRKTNGAYEATIKTKGQDKDGFSLRGEYTVPLKDKTIVTKGFNSDVDNELAELLTDSSLQEMFATVVERRTLLLQVTTETLLEMAIDRGEIQTVQGNDTIDEVELEIKNGKQEDLLSFVAELKKHFIITMGTKSKWQRGMELLTKRPL